MLVNLDNLHYRAAIDIIGWAASHDIDSPKCFELLNALSTTPVPDVDWTLDIPDQYVTWLLLSIPTLTLDQELI